MRIRSAMAGLLLCLSCAVTPPQAHEVCVSSCTSVEPEHPTDCEAACLAYEGDAVLATANVKENCELTEDPPPVPTSTEKWLCDGAVVFNVGCIDSNGHITEEIVSPKSEASGFADTQTLACTAAKQRILRRAQSPMYAQCFVGSTTCSGCARTP